MKTSDKGFTKYLKRRRLSPKTIKTFEKVLGTYKSWLDTENMEAEQAGYNDMLAFMKSLKHTSQRTVQHYMNTVRHYYDYLKERGQVADNPTTGIEVHGVKRKQLYAVIDPEQLNALYNNYPDKTLADKRGKVMLGLLVYQGLKTEELAKLETTHVKTREGKIEVPGGRTRNGRMLEMQPVQVLDMYDYMLQTRPQLLALPPKRSYQQPRKTERLFIGEGGSSSHFSNYVTGVMVKVRKTDPSVINARHLRFSVIVKWLKMYNLREVQQMAGHRYISSTEAYQHSDIEGLKEEINQYHPLG